MSSVYRYARDVMVDPHTFFKRVHGEKDFRKVLNFLTVFALSVFVILTFHYLKVFNSFAQTLNEAFGIELFSQIPLRLSTYIVLYMISVPVFLGLSFLRYHVTHLFVRMLGGKHDYRQTYKALVYTLSPEYLSMPLFVAVGVLLPVAYATGSVILWAVIAVCIVLFLGLGLYQVYLRTVGLAKLQTISYRRSFLAIYVLGFLTQLFIVLVIEIAILGLVLLLYFSL